jgi:hypothetical protein
MKEENDADLYQHSNMKRGPEDNPHNGKHLQEQSTTQLF